MDLKLVKKTKEAKGTWSFFFEPEKKVNYLPGQYFYITLPKLQYKDNRGPTRHFTISSSPTEELLRITTRIRKESGFKKTLNELELNSVVEGEGPNGTYILDEQTKGSHVFLAGGIGVTPYRSMIAYNIDKGLNTPMQLVYSNSVPEEISFLNELNKWAKEKSNLKVHPTVTRPEESKEKWNGIKGRIDVELLQELLTDYKSAKFWISGPPGMVDAMEKIVKELGITSENLRSEKFTGY